MTTDRKIFDFPLRRDIMAGTEYPGVAKLVSRLIWVRVAPPSSREIPCPRSLDTPAIQALPPQAEVVKKNRLTTCLTTSGAKLNYQKSGISAVGSALALGARCREFESPISDHGPLKSNDFRGPFSYLSTHFFEQLKYYRSFEFLFAGFHSHGKFSVI